MDLFYKVLNSFPELRKESVLDLAINVFASYEGIRNGFLFDDYGDVPTEIITEKIFNILSPLGFKRLPRGVIASPHYKGNLLGKRNLTEKDLQIFLGFPCEYPEYDDNRVAVSAHVIYKDTMTTFFTYLCRADQPGYKQAAIDLITDLQQSNFDDDICFKVTETKFYSTQFLINSLSNGIIDRDIELAIENEIAQVSEDFNFINEYMLPENKLYLVILLYVNMFEPFSIKPIRPTEKDSEEYILSYDKVLNIILEREIELMTLLLNKKDSVNILKLFEKYAAAIREDILKLDPTFDLYYYEEFLSFMDTLNKLLFD